MIRASKRSKIEQDERRVCRRLRVDFIDDNGGDIAEDGAFYQR